MVGTLLGVGVSQLLQQRSVARSERFTRTEQVRQERLQVYSSFAGSLMMYRRAQMERWLICNGGEFEESDAALRARAFDLRMEVYEGLFRVRLVTTGSAAADAAQEAMEVISRIPKAADEDAYVALAREAKQKVTAFVTVAKDHM
ncbi:hypothetical protein ACIBI4_14535 [Streptomyces sp. NPDC050418]|uniref:hypothetical protein n=1 Tax=Streptomyces sp. NPDC050418 TaxID=3365612 RepID=UPI0037ACBB7C